MRSEVGLKLMRRQVRLAAVFKRLLRMDIDGNLDIKLSPTDALLLSSENGS